MLSTPPVLVAPNEKEPLLLYIAATYQVVSTVLVVERSEEGKAHGVQRPVYFISKVLSPTKQRYPHYQKLAYSVFITARKLRQYFVVHPIIVVNEAPLSNILNRDFYFRALGSLVVLGFPQLLSFSSVLSKPLSETLTSAGTAGCPTGQQL
jgi:hypothetical protein